MGQLSCNCPVAFPGGCFSGLDMLEGEGGEGCGTVVLDVRKGKHGQGGKCYSSEVLFLSVEDDVNFVLLVS